MDRMWVRAAACCLIIAALVFAVANRWSSETRTSDHATAAETKSKFQRSGRTERRIHGEGVIDHLPIDTRELRSEALELLDGLEEFGKNIDEVERLARLSAIFRKWGRVDFDEAMQFIKTEPLARKFLSPDRSFADELKLATFIGYSGKDPLHAWDIFLTTQTDNNDRSLMSTKPHSYDVAAEEIMRALFIKSETTALKTLREVDPQKRFLVAPGLRALLSESDDAVFRLEVLNEFFDPAAQADRYRAGLVCAGLAEHDPQMAWESLRTAANGLLIDFDPELFLGFEFIENWSRRQPDEALRFVAEFEREEGQDSLLICLIFSQCQYRPELIVEALEMDSLKRFQEDFRPDLAVERLDAEIPWPLIDENVPLPRDERLDRLQQAVESSGISKKLKDDFLTAIEAAKLK